MELEKWMAIALSLARSASNNQEVPVGALIIKEGQIISTGINNRESTKDPCGHAEVIALRSASKALNRWRLSDCTLITTLEPCVMCAGAICMARVSRVVYGAKDPKGGAYGSIFSIHSDKRLNHNVDVTAGIMHLQCSSLLKEFFSARRK